MKHQIDPLFHLVVTVEPKDPHGPDLYSYGKLDLAGIDTVLSAFKTTDTIITDIKIVELDHEYQVRRDGLGWAEGTFDDLNMAISYAEKLNMKPRSSGNYYVKYTVI